MRKGGLLASKSDREMALSDGTESGELILTMKNVLKRLINPARFRLIGLEGHCRPSQWVRTPGQPEYLAPNGALLEKENRVCL
jgi:hypothetical protein